MVKVSDIEDTTLQTDIHYTVVVMIELHHVPFMSEKEYSELLDNAVIEDYTKGATKLEAFGIKLSDKYISNFRNSLKDHLEELRINGLVQSMYCFEIRGAMSEADKEKLLDHLASLGLAVFLEEMPKHETGDRTIFNDYKKVMSGLKKQLKE